MKTLIRFFSYIFHGVLALFLLVSSALVLGDGPLSLHLEAVPWWSGDTLAYIILAAGLVGLAAVALAVAGKLRIVFFIWSLAVLCVVIKGYVFSGYRFGEGQGLTVFSVILFSLIALAGAWFQLSAGPRKYRY